MFTFVINPLSDIDKKRGGLFSNLSTVFLLSLNQPPTTVVASTAILCSIDIVILLYRHCICDPVHGMQWCDWDKGVLFLPHGHVCFQECTSSREEIKRLRRENSTLEATSHEQEKTINQLKTRVAVMEQEIHDKEQVCVCVCVCMVCVCASVCGVF